MMTGVTWSDTCCQRMHVHTALFQREIMLPLSPQLSSLCVDEFGLGLAAVSVDRVGTTSWKHLSEV